MALDKFRASRNPIPPYFCAAYGLHVGSCSLCNSFSPLKLLPDRLAARSAVISPNARGRGPEFKAMLTSQTTILFRLSVKRNLWNVELTAVGVPSRIGLQYDFIPLRRIGSLGEDSERAGNAIFNESSQMYYQYFLALVQKLLLGLVCIRAQASDVA